MVDFKRSVLIKKEMIMKKVYMTPTTKWVEAQAEEMMTASLFEQKDGNLIQDLSSAPETTTETSGNLSRQGLWDFED